MLSYTMSCQRFVASINLEFSFAEEANQNRAFFVMKEENLGRLLIVGCAQNLACSHLFVDRDLFVVLFDVNVIDSLCVV